MGACDGDRGASIGTGVLAYHPQDCGLAAGQKLTLAKAGKGC